MNPYRDEFALTLSGKTFRLRPTFEALAEMEGETGVELLALATRLSGGKVSLKLASAVIAAGIRGAGGSVPRDLGELALKEGIVSVLQQLSCWLAGVFAGDKDAPAEVDSTKKD